MRTTSFAILFNETFDINGRQCRIKNISIPIIQRDYAQGRNTGNIPRIRKLFLDALQKALCEDEPLTLDFIYGNVENENLIPLDGQQRLTTLFLLHWYTAVLDNAENTDFMSHFTYETRFSSRDFCHRLAKERPNIPLEKPLSDYLKDQNWFVASWRHDPTVQSMLVMLDEIDARFRDKSGNGLWKKLTDSANPAVKFHFLVLPEMGLTDEIYIKMNSRGKALTEFEHFKAFFERLLKETSIENHGIFIKKVDNDWTDMLWPFRDVKNLIDDKFMRYVRFVSEIIAWQNKIQAIKTDDFTLAEQIYKDPVNAEENQNILISKLDCWLKIDIPDWFMRNFTCDCHCPGKISLFAKDTNLFKACCDFYGTIHGRNRAFSLQNIILLYAVVAYLENKSEEFPGRMRIVRNLVANSVNEIREDLMHLLLKEAETIVLTGKLDDLKTFNTNQIEEERQKRSFIENNPAFRKYVEELEDHDLLRGAISIIGFDPDKFEKRATAFLNIFKNNWTENIEAISGAILASGDYSRHIRGDRYQFISPDPSSTRTVLTSKSGRYHQTCETFRLFLDKFALKHEASVKNPLQDIINEYLEAQVEASRFDRRYYFVKYSKMRNFGIGIYHWYSDFRVCMLTKEQMNGWYSDPYLFAVYNELGQSEKDSINAPWFINYQPERWMTMKNSGAGIAFRDDGIKLKRPADDNLILSFDKLMKERQTGEDLLLKVEQEIIDDKRFDTENRIEIAIDIIKVLLCINPVSS